MIGIRREPRGGFGNRVLSYLSLRQIGYSHGVEYFSINRTDRTRIGGIHKPWRVPLRWRALEELPKDAPLLDDFSQKLRKNIDAGISTILKTPLLGEVLARFNEADSSLLTSSQMRLCKIHRAQHADSPWITLHLRGTDFATWNPDAILDADYYVRALEALPSNWAELPVRVCTDDLNHPAYEVLGKHLSTKTTVITGDKCTDPLDCDFTAMAQSKYLVASPSTFSIAAGLLGNTRTIHSEYWVENRIQRGELFWQKVKENSLRGYPIEGIV